MAHILNSLHFSPQQPQGKEDTITLPLLTKLGVPHAISIGPQAHNMAELFNHSHEDLKARQNEFLSKNNLETLDKAYFSTVPTEKDKTIEDIVLPNNSSQAIALPADVVFTQVALTPLIHKPADCPTAIIYAEKDDNSILGLAHLGRPQVNKRVTEQAIDHLFNHYQIKPQDIYIAISPSIGPKHYFIKAKDQEIHHFIDREYWREYAWKDTLQNETIIRIDVLGKILSILEKKGIPPENIEAYGHDDTVDTYELASLIPQLSFSHRFAIGTNQPQKNGRVMVAAQLEPMS